MKKWQMPLYPLNLISMNNKIAYPGFFISLEGPEGSGKSTLAKKLKSYLKEKKIDAIFTREPGGSDVAVCNQIRSLLLDNHGLDKRTEVLLFAANRSEHITKLIIPALTNKQIVVCDRYVDSSLAYQGFARGIGYKNVLKINQFATRKLLPDLTIFIDVPPAVGLKRIENSRPEEINHLDQESLSFHETVYAGYKKLAAKNKKRFVVIDGQQPVEVIFQAVLKAINKKLAQGKHYYHEI